MKIMAIDYGDAHTGIAISDVTGTLAGFTTVIDSRKAEVVVQEILHSLFSDGQNDEILSGTGFLQAFEKVDVIAASQAAVSGDDDVAVFFAGGFPGVNGGKIQVALCDVHQSLMEFTEVRAAGVCPVLGFPEFGGGHQFHGLGDLHGAFHTLDPKFYGFHICSHK